MSKKRLRSWAEIDLDVLSHNIGSLKKLAGADRLLMACVKSNAYGHGLVEVSRAAEAAGADRLAVAHVEEGLLLREAGVTLPIQVLMEPPVDAALEMARNDLIASLSSPAIAESIAAKLDRPLTVHVEVDTGMGRVSLQPGEAEAFISYIQRTACFRLEGVFSHFSSAGAPDDERSDGFTRKQLREFNALTEQLSRSGIQIPLKHMASSDAVAFYPESYLDMIRPGAWVYGYKGKSVGLDLQPVLSWKTRVLRVTEVPAGKTVGYEMAFCPSRDTRVAHLAVGYGDGYSRSLSGVTEVLIKGKRVPTVGLIGMESMMADVGGIEGDLQGEEAVLIGCQGAEQITAAEVAEKIGMFGVMITCGIKERVARIYKHEKTG